MLFRSIRDMKYRSVVTDECYGALWRYACRLSRNNSDAEDLLQETLTRAYERIEQLKSINAGRTWVYRIMYSIFVNHIHRSRRRQEIVLIHDRTVAPEEGEQAVDLVTESVRAELQDLPVLQRQTVEMYYFEELSLDEIAEVFEISINTVKQRLFRARESLRRAMKQSKELSGDARTNELGA